jgi:uncharacterized protein YdhG (YjbR/CyaY superfamily)
MATTAPKDVDEYIATAPEPARPMLKLLRETVLAGAPGVEERISYAMPTYSYRGKLLHFAGYSGHIGIYGASSAVGQVPGLETYMAEKGTLRFPLSQPLPVSLIRRLIEARVRQNDRAAPEANPPA